MIPNTPLVSVIMLTYNHKRYIRQAIESVLCQQTDFCIELLIGDDASTDGTDFVIREYADRHPDVIRAFLRPQNLGATKNLKGLLAQARGNYLASCEGDDYWTDLQKLQVQIDFLRSHPEYIGCTHTVRIVDESGRPHRDQCLRWLSEKQEYSLEDFKGLFLPGHPLTMVYRNIFLNNASDLEFVAKADSQVADRTIAMLLAARGKLFRIDRDMASYRMVLKKGGSNATSRLYLADKNSKLRDLRLNNVLELYARDTLGISADFGWFRRNLLLRSLAKAFLHPLKGYWNALFLMLQEQRNYRIICGKERQK